MINPVARATRATARKAAVRGGRAPTALGVSPHAGRKVRGAAADRRTQMGLISKN